MKKYHILLSLVTIFAAIGIAFPVFGQGGVKQSQSKQSFEATVMAQIADARNQHLTPKLGRGPAPVSCPDNSPVNQGIFTLNGVGHPPTKDQIVNYAVTVSKDGRTNVIYAGAPKDSPRKGFMLVMRYVKDPCAAEHDGKNSNTEISLYVYPHGPLKITSVKGENIIFESQDGGKGRFLYLKGQFAR